MRRATTALLLFTACGPHTPVSDAVCPHDPSLDRSQVVHVRAEIPPAILRRDLDLAGINRESGGSAGSGKLQGLTLVEHRLAFYTRVSFAASRGRACVWFDTVNVNLTPAAVSIFVPSEYPEGSCEYDAVLVHEREHERVHRERLEAAAKEIEAALALAKWLPARGNPFEAADRASAEATLNDKIGRVVRPVYDKYKEDLTVAQNELDKPALYQWVSKRCEGWK